jgi:hypothetical protein
MGFGNYTCNWGLHMAGLYETPKERDEIIFGFFNQGYLNGDLHLYAASERSPESFKKEFTHHCPGCKKDIENQDYFSIKTAKELYYPDDTFSPQYMDQSLQTFYEHSQKNGRRNIRATAEMAWALEAIPGVERLMAYESRLNYFIPGKPWISICLYNINKFDGKTIMGVLRTHPFTISGGIITQNPYFQDPDEWLAANAPEYLY